MDFEKIFEVKFNAKTIAILKISKATQEEKTWKAEETNLETGKKMTIQGGKEGVEVGKKNPQNEKFFDDCHDVTSMTPQKFINKLRWDDEAEIGSSVEILGELFKKQPK